MRKVKTMIENLQLLIQNSLVKKNYNTTFDAFWDISFDLYNVLIKDQVRIYIPQIKSNALKIANYTLCKLQVLFAKFLKIV